MQRFQEHAIDPAQSLGVGPDDFPEVLDADFHEQEVPSEEPASTDDPVRAYLREMGSVRLLNRQGEIDLARGMERGTLRTRKALSRSPLVWTMALRLYGDACEAGARLEDLVDIAGADEAAKKNAHSEIDRRFSRFARLHKELLEAEGKLASTP